MTDTYFDIFGQKSNAIFQQNNYSANTFHVMTDFLISTWRIKLSARKMWKYCNLQGLEKMVHFAREDFIS